MTMLKEPLTNPESPPSKITGTPTEKLFRGTLLDNYQVDFFRCCDTGFIQTEKPYWLEEAYSSTIAEQDSGLLQRCLFHRIVLLLLIRDNFPDGARCLDYGGGYGVLTRLMRDRNYEFYHHDPMCENLFAKAFEMKELPKQKVAMITAFEVFEHIEDPKTLVAQLMESTDTIVFSTLLVPEPCPTTIDDWWYFLPETAQHVSFYTPKSIQSLAESVDATAYSNGSSLHAISRRPLRFSAAGNGKIAKARRMIERALRG